MRQPSRYDDEEQPINRTSMNRSRRDPKNIFDEDFDEEDKVVFQWDDLQFSVPAREQDMHEKRDSTAKDDGELDHGNNNSFFEDKTSG
jgi:hypothetical protein